MTRVSQCRVTQRNSMLDWLTHSHHLSSTRSANGLVCKTITDWMVVCHSSQSNGYCKVWYSEICLTWSPSGQGAIMGLYNYYNKEVALTGGWNRVVTILLSNRLLTINSGCTAIHMTNFHEECADCYAWFAISYIHACHIISPYRL